MVSPWPDLDRKQLAKLRNKKLGFVFQSFNLLARTSAQENVELPLFYSHPLVTLRDRHERSVQALEKVGLGERRGHHPASFPADSNSASPSPARSSAGRKCCSPTNRPATSTPAPASKSWACFRS
jgi:ABC-type histidine transport system ATPase subunit